MLAMYIFLEEIVFPFFSQLNWGYTLTCHPYVSYSLAILWALRGQLTLRCPWRHTCYLLHSNIKPGIIQNQKMINTGAQIPLAVRLQVFAVQTSTIWASPGTL